MKRKRARARAAAVVALALGVSTAACSAGGPPSIVGKQTLRIGVKADQPGLGLRLAGGRFVGFDVDVARYVAAKLGVGPDHITFVPVTSATRETALQNGLVDMVVATYSITAERETKVTFGGPYYVAHQDPMVRASATAIRSVARPQGKAAVRGRWLQFLEACHAGAEHRGDTGAGPQLQRLRHDAAGRKGRRRLHR